MKGMTLDFSVTRIFDLERKEDVIVNRRMIDNYLTSLRNGLKKNKDQYLKDNNISEDQLKQIHAEKRFSEQVSNSQLRQFEVKGYQKMLEGILDEPLKSC